MRSLLQEAERKGIKVEFRPYESKALKGYRIVLQTDNRFEHHMFINLALDEEAQYEALLLLLEYTDEFIEYGFISIIGDNKLFIEEKFKLDKSTGFYNFSVDKSKNIININDLRIKRLNEYIIQERLNAMQEGERYE